MFTIKSHCDFIVCIREIGRIDPKDLERDASATRCYSEFLVELASRIPEHILPNISLLLCHLDTEVSFSGIYLIFSHITVFRCNNKDMLLTKGLIKRERKSPQVLSASTCASFDNQLALNCERFELVQISSQVFLNLRTLAIYVWTKNESLNKSFMTSFHGKRIP